MIKRIIPAREQNFAEAISMFPEKPRNVAVSDLGTLATQDACVKGECWMLARVTCRYSVVKCCQTDHGGRR